MLLDRLRERGSPAHAALLRVVLAVHVLFVLQSPALGLLIEVEPELHPQAAVVGGAAFYALLSPDRVALLQLVGTLAAACVAVGLAGRVALGILLISFLATQMYWFGGTLFHDDWIYFVFPMLAFLTATESTAYSVDGWLRRAKVEAETQRREARLIVESWVFWIGFVYLAAGIAKLFPLSKGVVWLSGIAAQEFAIEFVRQSPAVALFGEPVFPYEQRWIFMLGSIATVAIEIGAVAVWFTRRAYLPIAVGIFAMHIGIWLVGIPGFVGMFSVLVLALLPAGVFAKADAWWTRVATSSS